jgi:hypothetical protein
VFLYKLDILYFEFVFRGIVFYCFAVGRPIYVLNNCSIRLWFLPFWAISDAHGFQCSKSPQQIVCLYSLVFWKTTVRYCNYCMDCQHPLNMIPKKCSSHIVVDWLECWILTGWLVMVTYIWFIRSHGMHVLDDWLPAQYCEPDSTHAKVSSVWLPRYTDFERFSRARLARCKQLLKKLRS